MINDQELLLFWKELHKDSSEFLLLCFTENSIWVWKDKKVSTMQYLADTFIPSNFHCIQGAHFHQFMHSPGIELNGHPLPFSLNICPQAQCVTWRDEERVALFQLYSLAAVWTVTQEDITLFAWQHPVLIQRQIVWAWRNQPEDLENKRERESNAGVILNWDMIFLLWNE